MKRRADKQLTQDDDAEDDVDLDENAGTGFRRAQQSELQSRPIKGLPKRMQGSVQPTMQFSSGPGTSSSAFGSFKASPPAFPPPGQTFFGGTSGSPLQINAGGVSAGMHSSPNASRNTDGSQSDPDLRPGSPKWPSETARQAFEKSEMAIKSKLLRHGLNVSFVNAVQDLLKDDPAQNLADTIQPLLSTYKAHWQSVDGKYGGSQSQSGIIAGTISTMPRTTASSFQPAPPAAPPVPPSGPMMFGGKIATFDGSLHTSTPSGTSGIATSTVPSFGAFGSPKPVHDAVVPSIITTSTEPPRASDTSDLAHQKSVATTPSVDAGTNTFGGTQKTSLPSIFGEFGKPKVPSPLASQPPVTGDSSVTPTGPASSSAPPVGTLNQFGSTPNPFSAAADSTTTTLSFSSPSLFSQANKVPPPTTTSFGSALTGAQSFGFGRPATTSSTGFTFASAPLFASKSEIPGPAQEQTAENSGKEIVLPGASPASTVIGTRKGTPELEGEGEENEVTLHETRCKLYQATEKPGGDGIEWTDKGVGSLRLKKDKDSEKRRLLFRQEGTLRVQMNFYLFAALEASVDKKIVSLTGLDEGKPCAFRMRCKSEEDAAAFQTRLQQEVENMKASAAGAESAGNAESDQHVADEKETAHLQGAGSRSHQNESLKEGSREEEQAGNGEGVALGKDHELGGAQAETGGQGGEGGEDGEDGEEEGDEVAEGDEGDQGEGDHEAEYGEDEYEYEVEGGDEEAHYEGHEEDGDAEGEDEDEEDQLAEGVGDEEPAQPEVVELLSDDDEE